MRCRAIPYSSSFFTSTSYVRCMAIGVESDVVTTFDFAFEISYGWSRGKDGSRCCSIKIVGMQEAQIIPRK